MTILHFAEHQNDVFLPALIALLVAAIAVAVPVVLAPTLRRQRRLTPVLAVGLVVAAASVVVAAWQAGVGFRTLADERMRVQAELAERYGVTLSTAEVGELVDGGRPKVSLPAQAEALDLADASAKHALELVETADGSDEYDLTYAGRALAAS